MKKIIVVFVYLLASNIFAVDNASDLELRFSHSMRLDNYQVSILIKNDIVTVIEENANGKINSRKVKLTEQQIKILKRLRDNIDFESKNPEFITGVDGHTIAFTSNGKSISAWVPSYDTEKRGLVNFLKLSLFLFNISGLNDEALPVK